MILQAEGLDFRYPPREVLRQISLRVHPGEMLVLLGPNGSGKTTLLRCLDGLLSPHGGTVLLGDRPLDRLGAKDVARTLGYVPQRSEPRRLAVYDAVLLGRLPHIRGRISRRDHEAVERALEDLGLQSLALRSLDEMSGGEAQKVLLARALAQEPRILLLDEPTSNLDLRNQVEILQLLRRCAAERDLGVILTLHDLNTAFRYGDRFLFLKKGRVRHLLTREEISAPVLEEVYDLPVQLARFGGFPVVVPFRT